MQSNVRFVALWAALVPVLTGACYLIEPLGIASWTETQTGLTVAEVNAASALVLALVAFFWARSVKEPAALQGAVSAVAVATLALGSPAGFAWWSFSDKATALLVSFVGLVLVLILTLLNRMVAYAPETVEVEVAKAQTPDVVFGAIADKLQPPA